MLGQAFADTGKLFEFFVVLGNVFDALVKAVKQLGSLFVAAVTADLRPVNFEKLRRLAQDFRYFLVFQVGLPGWCDE